MSAYPSTQRDLITRAAVEQVIPLPSAPAGATADRRDSRPARSKHASETGSFLDQLVDQLAEKVAVMVLERLSSTQPGNDDWLDCRHAAEYLGVHRDTVRKLAAERAIPSEQDGPGVQALLP